MTQSNQTAVFSDLVGAIYDCAVDPELWPETLGRLASELRFATAVLALTSLPSGRQLLNITSGISPEWMARLADYAGDIVDMWGGPAVMESYPFDRPSVLSRVNPAGLTSGNPFVEQWGRPQGLFDTMVVILTHDAQAIGNIGFGRHIDAGPIEDRDIELTRLYIPHLQRAVHIGRLLDVARLTASSFEQVLGALTMPVMLVDRDLALVHANDAGWSFLADDGGLALRDGRLAAHSPVTQRLLVDTVEQAGFDEAGLSGGGIGIPVLAGADSGVSALHVLPLSHGAVRLGLGHGAAAAIFVAGASTTPGRACKVLSVLYALTPAETRVLEQIAAGRSGGVAANELGIAPSTVKTHLLRIFDKTGTRSQADLARLTVKLASPIANPTRTD